MTDTLTLSLIIGAFVGIAAGYLGSLMVLEKMALVGDALSHVALPGVALGYVYSFNPFLGAFAFLFVATMIIWYVGRVSKLSYETIVGAMFTLSLAIGIIIIPTADLLDALFGSITDVTMIDTIAAIVICTLAIILIKVVYDKLVLGMISEELAISKGVNVARINLLYLLLVSLIVAVGIKIVGTLLVGFLVVVPAAAAKNVSQNLFKYALLSSVFGAISAISGVLLADIFNASFGPGPLVVISGVVIFVASIIVRWKTK